MIKNTGFIRARTTATSHFFVKGSERKVQGPRIPVRPLFAAGSIALLAVTSLATAHPTDPCKTPLLPAYAHNDYLNSHPLLDALDGGYRGVEVDVFRAGGDLLVGHERRALDKSRTLRWLYLEPLQARVRTCGSVLGDSSAFFLNVELKEADTAAFQLLLAQLRDHEDLFRTPRPGEAPSVQVTLVGWWPEQPAIDAWPGYLLVHLVIDHHGNAAESVNPERVGLISIDYRKALNVGVTRAQLPAEHPVLTLARNLAARLEAPVRVHHVPVDGRVYHWLLDQGVTLIGADDLRRSASLLGQVAPY